jgi:hypothetical protein
MRSRALVALSLAMSSLIASEAQSQNDTDGLVRGDYVRAAYSWVSPVSPSGSLKQWERGNGVNLMWENWDNAGNGLSLFGFGLYVDMAFLPFDEEQFKTDFTNGPHGPIISATASRARVLQIGVNTRLRAPVKFITPSISLGFGFLDWRPGEIDYNAVGGTGTAKQQNRQGGIFTVIAGLDKHIYGRVAVYGEAAYGYGFTSFGQGLASTGSACIQQNCDLLKNTPLGSFRTGLRVRAK